jgi:hypothetical protein
MGDGRTAPEARSDPQKKKVKGQKRREKRRGSKVRMRGGKGTAINSTASEIAIARQCLQRAALGSGPGVPDIA